MFCTAAHFTSDTKPFFADAVCKYGGLLMHTKVRSAGATMTLSEPRALKSLSFCLSQMIICLFRSTNSLPLKASAPSQTSTGGWAYVAGSHNLSQAAWVSLDASHRPELFANRRLLLLRATCPSSKANPKFSRPIPDLLN